MHHGTAGSHLCCSLTPSFCHSLTLSLLLSLLLLQATDIVVSAAAATAAETPTSSHDDDDGTSAAALDTEQQQHEPSQQAPILRSPAASAPASSSPPSAQPEISVAFCFFHSHHVMFGCRDTHTHMHSTRLVQVLSVLCFCLARFDSTFIPVSVMCVVSAYSFCQIDRFFFSFVCLCVCVYNFFLFLFLLSLCSVAMHHIRHPFCTMLTDVVTIFFNFFLSVFCISPRR